MKLQNNLLSACILDQGQVTKYFCVISLVMYLVYYNYSNAGPECQARVGVVSDIPRKNFFFNIIIISSLLSAFLLHHHDHYHHLLLLLLLRLFEKINYGVNTTMMNYTHVIKLPQTCYKCLI